MVIWITGLSGAGKTTVCTALRALLKPQLPEVVMLDGDVVRAAFGHDLKHHESDRVIQVKRLQGMSRALSQQGLCVMVAVLYNNPELLAWNRANFPDYFEVYIDAPLSLVQSRNPKQLYSRALSGEERNVVGVDIPWHTPRNPDLVLNAALQEPADVVARRIVEAYPKLRQMLAQRRTGF